MAELLMDFGLGETADAIRESTARFAAANIAPLAAEIDAGNVFPRELWPAMGIGSVLGNIVAAAQGDTTAAGWVRDELPNLAAAPDWSALAQALERILAGERDPGRLATLIDPSHRAAVATVLHYIGSS